MDNLVDFALRDRKPVENIVSDLMAHYHGRFATRDDARAFVQGRIAFHAAQQPAPAKAKRR